MSSGSSLPTAWTSPHAQLSAPTIAVTTNAVSSLGERYYTQQTPSTQEVLRQAAKSSSAEYLLSLHAVSEAADTAGTCSPHSEPPLALHPPLSTTVPTATNVSTTAGRADPPANTNLHPTPSPVVVAVPSFLGASQQLTRMAATSTAALGHQRRQRYVHTHHGDPRPMFYWQMEGATHQDRNDGGRSQCRWRWQVNTMTAGSFKHDAARGTPLQSNVVSPSAPESLSREAHACGFDHCWSLKV
ncbi:hypothetical_protein (plasmid) [Leishmania braziliensis MHOM/BR/75/M2904]|uniref:Hypothetical_protein n=1 Tax=Leishmania braziliensis MHOM/BR/75/M2904 TaxID=420245 RepID=A0A3P3YXD8_LEIBR|nr:unnamed protein product [Leishmania braziliensis]SYZ62634.1 hypothetical_protein [Leishmania braziliensis MHOM/BR/75/M2904]